ncbi:3453_t:CDS:2, partial [Cetraspora pellucida]
MQSSDNQGCVQVLSPGCNQVSSSGCGQVFLPGNQSCCQVPSLSNKSCNQVLLLSNQSCNQVPSPDVLIDNSVLLLTNYVSFSESLFKNCVSHQEPLSNNHVSDFVKVKVPRIDRFNIDHPTVPCKVLEKTDEDQYQLECKFGIIKICYILSKLEMLETITCSELYEIPSNQVSIHEAARLQSVETML